MWNLSGGGPFRQSILARELWRHGEKVLEASGRQNLLTASARRPGSCPVVSPGFLQVVARVDVHPLHHGPVGNLWGSRAASETSAEKVPAQVPPADSLASRRWTGPRARTQLGLVPEGPSIEAGRPARRGPQGLGLPGPDTHTDRGPSHLILGSFVPRVQLEGEGQPAEVEVEELLCCDVNCRGQTEAGWRIRPGCVCVCVCVSVCGGGAGSTSWVRRSERLVYLLDGGGDSLRVEMDAAERQRQA